MNRTQFGYIPCLIWAERGKENKSFVKSHSCADELPWVEENFATFWTFFYKWSAFILLEHTMIWFLFKNDFILIWVDKIYMNF